LIELDKLAYAASLTPFIPAGVKEHPREEVFKMLKEAPDPYERFKKIAKAAIAKNEKLAEPWESPRVLIMPKRSEERRLMKGKAYRELDEGKKKALFYATLALEEAFGVYSKDVEEREKVVQRVKVGVEPFERVMYVADLGRLTQLAEEEGKAFGDALSTLRERLNEYTARHGLGDLLNVEEGKARELAEAEEAELPKFSGVNFGVKALAALIAYREYALGRRGVFGIAAWHWLEMGGSARLFYYTPSTAYEKAKKAGMERPVAVEEMLAEAFRHLFLKPGADYHRRFIEEPTKGGRLALMLEEDESSYMFKLFRLEEDGELKELGIKLWIEKVGEEGASIVYFLELDARWREFFKQELEASMKAAEEVGGRLPVEDRFPYMLGWVDSDVAIIRRGNKRVLEMSTSYLWQLAETHALFGWSVVELRMSLTLEGPKLQVAVEASLEKLNEAIRKSAEGGWLKMFGIKAESWEGLRRWVVENWDVVVEAAVRRLGEGVRSELEALRNRLNDDKIAREVVAPALLLIQAEKLGVNEATLRYFGAVVSSAIDGDGHVSAARKEVVLTSGKRAIALLWAATLAAHGIRAKVQRVGSAPRVLVSGNDATRLVGLYFLYGAPLLEGDERVINHKLAEAVKLGAEGLSVSWEGLRKTEGGLLATDLTISAGGATVKYNVYLSNKVKLQFQSSDRSRVELAARLLKLAGVGADVKKMDGKRDVSRVEVSTDKLAAGRRELRNAIADIVRKAVENGWMDTNRAEGWLEKLEEGLTLIEGWPRYHVGLARSGALVVRFGSTSPDSIERERQRLREMGLEEGRHFTVKMPEGGKKGYVSILKEGLAYAAWLSVYGSGRQRELAAEFVEYILQRAWKAGKDVYEKVREIMEEGKARGSLTLKGFEKEVEVNCRKHVVKVIGDGAEFDVGRSGKLLLRIRITAEVNGVRREYVITYSRYGAGNRSEGYAVASADAPGGRETDAERLAAVIETLTGVKPRIRHMKNGAITIECGR
jgi:hypothetical protein